jgi:hypothetical protein
LRDDRPEVVAIVPMAVPATRNIASRPYEMTMMGNVEMAGVTRGNAAKHQPLRNWLVTGYNRLVGHFRAC